MNQIFQISQEKNMSTTSISDSKYANTVLHLFSLKSFKEGHSVKKPKKTIPKLKTVDAIVFPSKTTKKVHSMKKIEKTIPIPGKDRRKEVRQLLMYVTSEEQARRAHNCAPRG